MGIDTISAGLSEETDSIEDTIEPFLLALGFIARTPRGRVLTQKAMDYIGYFSPENLAGDDDCLF